MTSSLSHSQNLGTPAENIYRWIIASHLVVSCVTAKDAELLNEVELIDLVKDDIPETIKNHQD